MVQLAIGTLTMALGLRRNGMIGGVALGFLLGVPLGIGVTQPLPALAFPAIGLFALTSVVPT